MGRFPPLLQNLLLASATVAIFLGGAEGVCRLLEPQAQAPSVAAYITDWTEWSEGDFYTVKKTAAGWPPFEDYNSDGLRDREHLVEKPAGVRRLICLGDSTTAGYRIRPREAYPQVLQDDLDALGLRVEVFNVALGGWSTRQELIAYREIARKYKPDHVLVGVCLNDIPELGNNLSRPPAWLGALNRRSALVRRLVRASEREIRSIEELLEPKDSPRVLEAYRRFFTELRSLRDAAREDGATFGLLVFPFRLQIDPDAPPPRPQQAIAEFCAAERIPCLDLLPALRTAGAEAFVDYDHFSPSGNRLVAQQILAAGLIPEEAPPSGMTEAAYRTAIERGRVVSSTQSDASLGALLESLRSPDPERRSLAARELGRRGAAAQEAVPALAAALRDTATDVRLAAAWALGHIGPAPATNLQALAGALSDASPAVRAGAAWALGRLGPQGKSAGPALALRLRDEDVDVRRRAVTAIEQVRPEASDILPTAIAVLDDARAPGRAGAARAVRTLGTRAAAAVPALVRALRDGNTEVRQEAVAALAAIGPAASAAVPALVEALGNPDLGWRVPDALGAIGPAARDAVPALTAALGASDATVRWRAAKALGGIGPDASPAASSLARLVDDPQVNVRLGAVTALPRVRAPARICVAALSRALKDREGQVRRRAADGLGSLGPAVRDAVPGLIGALADEDPWVRASAARALAEIAPGSSAVAKALRRARDDDEPMVQAAVEASLKRLSPP